MVGCEIMSKDGIMDLAGLATIALDEMISSINHGKVNVVYFDMHRINGDENLKFEVELAPVGGETE